jgi:hypothetical protein
VGFGVRLDDGGRREDGSVEEFGVFEVRHGVPEAEEFAGGEAISFV